MFTVPPISGKPALAKVGVGEPIYRLLGYFYGVVRLVLILNLTIKAINHGQP